MGVAEEKRPSPVFVSGRWWLEPSLESPESNRQLGTTLRTLLLPLLPCGNFISTHSLVWRGERTQDGGARAIVFVSSPPPPPHLSPPFPPPQARQPVARRRASARRPGLTAAPPTHCTASAARPRPSPDPPRAGRSALPPPLPARVCARMGEAARERAARAHPAFPPQGVVLAPRSRGAFCRRYL